MDGYIWFWKRVVWSVSNRRESRLDPARELLETFVSLLFPLVLSSLRTSLTSSIHPSIRHPLTAFPLRGCGEASVYPSCLQVRGRAHPGQDTYIHTHIHTEGQFTLAISPHSQMKCLWTVGGKSVLRNESTAHQWPLVLPVTFSCNVRRTSLDPYCSSQV